MHASFSHSSRGLTVIEILIVLAIVSLLFIFVFLSVRGAVQRGYDSQVRSDVRQLRLLAEEVFDNTGAIYLDWTQNSLVQAQVVTLQQDIEAAHGRGASASDGLLFTPTKSVIIDNRHTEYCISAELVREAKNGGTHLCVDASGRFQEVAQHCQEPLSENDPLVCPSS